HLDIEIPAPISGLGLRIALHGKQIDWDVPEDGAGRVARLRIGSDLVSQPVTLDVWYQLPAGRSGGNLLRSILQAPQIRGAPEQCSVRWEINLPPGWVPLAPEGGPGGERTWAFHRRLLTPRLAVSYADLERWYAGQELTGGS